MEVISPDIIFRLFFLLYSLHDTVGMFLIQTRMQTLDKILSNGGILVEIIHNLAAVGFFELLRKNEKSSFSIENDEILRFQKIEGNLQKFRQARDFG